MTDLRGGIQAALTYIEANLTGELEIRSIAKQAFLSPFYFQRIFGAMCGISVGEYIRSRRLTLAGEELSSSDAKVIDIASFARQLQPGLSALPRHLPLGSPKRGYKTDQFCTDNNQEDMGGCTHDGISDR